MHYSPRQSNALQLPPVQHQVDFYGTRSKTSNKSTTQISVRQCCYSYGSVQIATQTLTLILAINYSGVWTVRATVNSDSATYVH